MKGGERMQEANEMRDRLVKEFAENYMEKLFYFCLKRTGSNTEAEDLTQDIALQIITALNKGTIPTSFSAWVWKIARNRYFVWAAEKHNRNESVTGFDIGDYEIEDEGESILDEMIHAEQLALLRRVLAFIKSDYRDIVVAYYIENRNLRDIASSLSLSENTVKQRLFRTRQILKEGMDMAREFGKRSYNPEEIVYTNICTRPGDLGQPWTLMDPKLNQNVFLACYDNPMTVQDLAIEVGVALADMEDTVRHLEWQTRLVKNGDKYETNFPIINRETHQKLHFYYEGIMPQLISLLTEYIDILIAQYREAGLCYYGEYQSYEEAKWMILPYLYKGLYSLCGSTPKTKLGNTKRPDKGVWDVVGFEKCDFAPEGVGFSCKNYGYSYYCFTCSGRTPVFLSEDEIRELRLMVENKKPTDISAAEKLVKYGYAYRKDEKYVPKVAVMSQSTHNAFVKFCQEKNHSTSVIERAAVQIELYKSLMEMLDNINQTVRNILSEDLPKHIRDNKMTVDALLEPICTTGHTIGYIAKYALTSGWLKYDDGMSPAIGAYFDIP